MSQPTNLVSRDAIVAKARELLGMRFRFYGRSRDRGVDCVGVVLLTGWELGLLPKDAKIPDYPFPVSPSVFTAFAEYMDERDGYAEGAVAIWSQDGQPKHVGVLTYKDRWRCIGVDWVQSRRWVTCYTPTGLDAWKIYDYRGIE